MPSFFASAAMGLAEPLETELKELGFEKLERVASGVFFESNWEGCYKANLYSRLATRILKPVLDFTAYQGDELYHNLMKHDFTKYILPSQTIKVEASVKDSMFRDQRFVAMKVKDAVVDQFRDKFGIRPDVNTDTPDLKIFVRCYKNQFNISIDTSGDSLFMRGYRKVAGEAPLKENLAAGLLMLANWDKASPIVDPTCGSGTILIEAAMMAMKIAPGSLRKAFGFEKLLGFQREVWDKLVTEALDNEVTELPFKMYGYDIDRQVLKYARENAERAGVDQSIELKFGSVSTLHPPVEKGMLVANPPYGARLGEEDNLRDVYKDLSHTLKHNFKGWDAWILSGNKDLIADLKLKSTRKHFVYNGPIECRFLKYSMF